MSTQDLTSWCQLEWKTMDQRTSWWITINQMSALGLLWTPIEPSRRRLMAISRPWLIYQLNSALKEMVWLFIICKICITLTLSRLLSKIESFHMMWEPCSWGFFWICTWIGSHWSQFRFHHKQVSGMIYLLLSRNSLRDQTTSNIQLSRQKYQFLVLWVHLKSLWRIIFTRLLECKTYSKLAKTWWL